MVAVTTPADDRAGLAGHVLARPGVFVTDGDSSMVARHAISAVMDDLPVV
jgi:hypothetical protein